MNAEKRAEIYTYEAPWMIYACNWSVRGERGDGLGTRARENCIARATTAGDATDGGLGDARERSIGD